MEPLLKLKPNEFNCDFSMLFSITVFTFFHFNSDFIFKKGAAYESKQTSRQYLNTLSRGLVYLWHVFLNKINLQTELIS